MATISRTQRLIFSDASGSKARKIDEKQMKFVELKPEGLRYACDGIITADGGL